MPRLSAVGDKSLASDNAARDVDGQQLAIGVDGLARPSTERFSCSKTQDSAHTRRMRERRRVYVHSMYVKGRQHCWMSFVRNTATGILRLVS